MFGSYLHSKSIDCHGDFIQNTQGSVSKIYLFHCYLGHIWCSICQQLPLFCVKIRERKIYIYKHTQNMKVPEILFGFLLKSKVRN